MRPVVPPSGSAAAALPLLLERAHEHEEEAPAKRSEGGGALLLMLRWQSSSGVGTGRRSVGVWWWSHPTNTHQSFRSIRPWNASTPSPKHTRGQRDGGGLRNGGGFSRGCQALGGGCLANQQKRLVGEASGLDRRSKCERPHQLSPQPPSIDSDPLTPAAHRHTGDRTPPRPHGRRRLS